MRFAAIADDYTGGSDLASMLFLRGVPTVQCFGVPAKLPDAEAVVVSIKSRSVEPEEAVRMSLEALDAIRRHGPLQIQFKYCSTFDSTERGNIGPVTDALMDALGERFTIALPAFPENGRTQYLGHLFVKGELLSESPMRSHPLNPMTDSNLVRWLGRQSRKPVGLIPWSTVAKGPEAVRRAMANMEGIALVDCLGEGDVLAIAEASRDLRLITGGSAIARHLRGPWDQYGKHPAPPPRARPSKTLILAGSCSAATLEQVREFHRPAVRLGPNSFDDVARGAALVASSAAPEDRDTDPGAAARIERAFGELARRAVAELGVTDLIVAGGETSGAVVEALGIEAVQVTGIVATGVPALCAVGPDPIRLVLKSGNFGQPDFFARAIQSLEHR